MYVNIIMKKILGLMKTEEGWQTPGRNGRTFEHSGGYSKEKTQILWTYQQAPNKSINPQGPHIYKDTEEHPEDRN